MIRVALADWVASHPYLRAVAALHVQVETAVSAISVPEAAVPAFDDYTADFHAGVPLLGSARVHVDLAPAEEAVVAVIEKLAASNAPGPLTAQCRSLSAAMPSTRGASATPPAGTTNPTDHAGVLRYLTWTVVARSLRPAVAAFARWRDDERWLRSGCPTCGAGPAMGQLVGQDPGRLRLMSCGHCRTRWRYRRTGCPFCDNQHDHRLSVVAIEGESGLRLDVCDACSGYLKTFNGEGSEEVLLADWTSLHLDLLAADRGLKRKAASLYEL